MAHEEMTEEGNDAMTGVKKTLVLIVSDEPVLLESISRGLFLYGYDCVTARDVVGALEYVYGAKGETPDVLITDLMMPYMKGDELIRIVRAFRPRLPIIVIVGLKATPETERLEKSSIPVIRKPFDPEHLDRDIQALLESSRGDGSGR